MWLDKSLLTILTSIVLYLFVLTYLKFNKFKLKNIISITLLYFYGIIVFHITILPIPLDKIGVEALQRLSENNTYIQLIPFINFYTYSKFNLIRQVIGNFILFMPLGFLLPLTYDKCKVLKNVIIYLFSISISIELLQLIICIFLIKAPYRIFDIDDLFFNTLGGLIGYIFYVNIIQLLKPKSSEIKDK